MKHVNMRFQMTASVYLTGEDIAAHFHKYFCTLPSGETGPNGEPPENVYHGFTRGNEYMHYTWHGHDVVTNGGSLEITFLPNVPMQRAAETMQRLVDEAEFDVRFDDPHYWIKVKELLNWMIEAGR